MDFELTPEQEQLRMEVRSFIREHATPEIAREHFRERGGAEQEIGPLNRQLLRKMGEQGLLGVSWPEEYGGKGRSAIDQWIVLEELSYAGLSHGGLTITAIGPTIARLGSEELKRKYLPRMLRGEIYVAVGYTEPNAGTDLASLETRAVRDGNHYVVNGQKTFITGAENADYIWLACRTDPTAVPKHRGISVLMVPTDSPGITIQPLYPMDGGRVNQIFLDDVRVPVSELVGEENKGWRAIMMALNFERIFPHTPIRILFDRMVACASSVEVDGQPLIRDPRVRQTLARLAIDVEVSRLFAMRTAWLNDQGMVPAAEASMNKIWMSELRQNLGNAAMEMLGPRGTLRWSDPEAAMDGAQVKMYLWGSIQKFAAGTNESMRNIIAQLGLGLPRD